jgi:hypothetical protein
MKRTLAIVLFIQFFVYVGFGIIIPIMPEVVVDVSGGASHIGECLRFILLLHLLLRRPGGLWLTGLDGKRYCLLV